jgi:hypothetical protein
MRIFKAGILIVVLSTIAQIAQAQIGVRSSYHHTRINPWEAVTDRSAVDNTYSGIGYTVGLDYWFRLEDHRVEFFPEIQYSRVLSFELADNASSVLTNFGLELNTHFYLMDFFDDCDCPTFSKKSNWFQKGFFLSASAGALMYNFPEINTLPGFNQFVGSGSIGAGMDIGLSDFFTITPFVKWKHFFTPTWEGMTTVFETNSTNPSEMESRYFAHVQGGVRLGLRF